MKLDSLCSRILKSHCFPNSEFMNAIVPKLASPIWRAIVDGREALKVGLIKRVGDGASVPSGSAEDILFCAIGGV